MLIGIVTCTLEEYFFIPFQLQRFQGGDNLTGGFRAFTRGIQIFDSQQPASIVGTCIQVACQRGNQ